jgi:hypothetical protein
MRALRTVPDGVSATPTTTPTPSRPALRATLATDALVRRDPTLAVAADSAPMPAHSLDAALSAAHVAATTTLCHFRFSCCSAPLLFEDERTDDDAPEQTATGGPCPHGDG